MAIDWEEFERLCAEREDGEHPEIAYRRGVMQGAYFVLEALEADPDAIDRKLLADVRRYVNCALTRWRYGSRLRRLRRFENPPRVRRRQSRRQAADQGRPEAPQSALASCKKVQSPQQGQAGQCSTRDGAVMTEWVCAWCDVDNRVPCEMRDENGVVIQTWTRCAYCGRTELRLGKLGHQTPSPKSEPWDIEAD